MIDSVVKILPPEIKLILDNFDESGKITEIHIRQDEPVELFIGNRGFFSDSSGTICDKAYAYRATKKDIKAIIEYASEFSPYAYEDEIKNGYLTIQGGNRIGICGKTIIENGQIKNIRDITSLNIRISRNIPGCAEKIIDRLLDENGLVHNTLIISPPGFGKTTLLKDIIRIISEGSKKFKGMNVGVVDERGELSMGKGLGCRSDVLINCPKSKGIMMLIRSMSPKVVAVDEIGNEGDEKAILYSINSGCRIIATIHAYSIEDYFNKKSVSHLVREGVFKRFVILSDKNGPGSIYGIYNEKGEKTDA